MNNVTTLIYLWHYLCAVVVSIRLRFARPKKLNLD